MRDECDDPGYSERDYEIRAMNRDKRAWDKLWRDETNDHNR